MKWKKLLETEPCTAPEGQWEKAVGRCQLVEVDEHQALEVDLFVDGQLKARYFADQEEMAFNAFIGTGWRRVKIDNVARICQGKTHLKNDYYYCSNEWEFASEADKKMAATYLDDTFINWFENSVIRIKNDRAYERKQQRIEDMMAAVPCVPDEAEAWVKDKVFQGDLLFLQKDKKKTTYSCTACGAHSWKKVGWKHGEQTTCPKCGAPVTAYSRRQEKKATEPVIILQTYEEKKETCIPGVTQSEKKWIERQFKAVCSWTPEGKEIEMYEQRRAIIPEGECWGKVWNGQLSEADEFTQEFWDRNRSNKRFLQSYLWPGNLKEVLPCGHLENSGLDLMANKGQKFDVNTYITTFHQRPWLEYLAKAGLVRMVQDIVRIYRWYGNPNCIYEEGQTLQDALRIDGNRVSRMKQVNGGLNTLEWLQYEEQQGIKITTESLQWLADNNLDMEECTEILHELRSVNRMVNYMKKQDVKPKDLVTTWKDYLRMAAAAGHDTTDDIVRLPKDLRARHDQLVEMAQEKDDKERLKEYRPLDKKIKNRLPEVRRYFWENQDYMVIPAGCCEELMKEGRLLHHCVARDSHYMKKMADGKSWICFLRKKDDLETPYYTLEVDMKDDHIIQWYSKFDRKPDEKEIRKVLTKYKNSIKQKQEKVAIPIEQPQRVAIA